LRIASYASRITFYLTRDTRHLTRYFQSSPHERLLATMDENRGAVSVKRANAFCSAFICRLEVPHKAFAHEIVHNLMCIHFGRLIDRTDPYLGVLRRFIGVVNSGEPGDLAAPGFGI